MLESDAQRNARWEQEKQTKAMQDQAAAAQKQTEILQRQEYDRKRVEKKARRNANTQAGKANFHGLYCLLIGWWLSVFLVCIIVPLFFPGGRLLIKKAFGIW
jgi:Flp pilus assembly protein TadB